MLIEIGPHSPVAAIHPGAFEAEIRTNAPNSKVTPITGGVTNGRRRHQPASDRSRPAKKFGEHHKRRKLCLS